MKKLACVMLLACLTAAGLTGCTKGNDAKQTTLYVDHNGRVTSAIVESLDKDYYDMKELQDWTQQEVDAYNKENGDDAVVIKKCEKEDKNAKVTLEYASMKDYSEFNHVDAFFGTIEEAAGEGYDFEDEFDSAKGKPSIGYTELEGSKEYYVLITEESQTIVLDDDILYASPNVKVKGDTADIENDNKGLAYIIYKP